MIFALFFFGINAVVLNYTTGTDAYSYNKKPSESPITLNLQKGLALMMAVWSDATLTITIPNEFSQSRKITAKDGYSIFTFKDSATIKIEYTKAISYCVISCPQMKSNDGAIQFFSNNNNHQISMEEQQKDIYFSVFADYNMRGEVEQSALAKTVLHYYDSSNKEQTTSNINTFSLSQIRFTSKLIRTLLYSKLTLNNIIINTTKDFIPTNPTYLYLQWDKVSENSNNFLTNMAYGGNPSLKTNITKLIKNFPSSVPTSTPEPPITPTDEPIQMYFMKLYINIPSGFVIGIKDLSSSSSEIEEVSNNKQIDEIQGEYFEYQIYLISSPNCHNNYELMKVPATTSQQYRSITISDIPDECKVQYYVKVKNDITSSDYQLYIKNTQDQYVQIQKEIYEFSQSKSFTLEVYIKSSRCQIYQSIGQVSSSTDKNKIISVTDQSIPDSCKVITYNLCFDLNGIPNEYTIRYTNSYETDGQKHEAKHDTNKLSFNNPFSVTLYVSSNQCQDVEYKTINSGEGNSCLTINEQDLPENCRPVVYKVCFDLTSISNYRIGYKLSIDSESEIKELTSAPIQSETQFTITLYLLSSSECQNKVLKTYESSIDFTCVALTEALIPDECKETETYYVQIRNDITSSEYQLFVKNEQGEYTKIIKGEIYKESKSYNFNVEAFVISSKCTSYTSIETVQSSTDDNHITSINDISIPSNCLVSQKYGVCLNLALLPKAYTVYYHLSNKPDDQLAVALHGRNTFTSNVPFNTLLYVDSENCEKESWMNIQSKIEYECLEISESDIPQKCLISSNKPADDGQSGGNKGGISMTIIIIIIGVVAVVIIVVVVVVIVVIKKKKSNQFDANSQTLGSNLLLELSQQSSNF